METKQLIDSLMLAIDSALANVHTHTIARVTAVGEKTVSCRPVINRVVEGESIALPEFIEVPPVFMQGGGSYTAYPITVDDYCLLLITERCFDRWYAGQDYQSPPEIRMHDYSDGFALIGINPFANAITIPSDIRQVGDAHRTGQQTIIGDVIVTGSITATGDIEADGEVTGGGVALSTHVHPIAWTDPAGSGSTGAPA